MVGFMRLAARLCAYKKGKERVWLAAAFLGMGVEGDEWEGRMDKRHQLAAIVKIRNKQKKETKKERKGCVHFGQVASLV